MKRWYFAMTMVVSLGWWPTWAPAVEVVEIEDAADAAASPAATPASADCPAGTTRQSIDLAVKPPEGAQLSTVVFDIDYPEKRVAIPGSRNQPSVSERLSGAPGAATVAMNDKDGSLRVVLTASVALPTEKRMFALEFDVCAGATPPVAADYGCSIGGCVAMTAPVEGCQCSVALSAAAPAAKP